MENKYINPQYILKYDIKNIPKNSTISNKSKTICLNNLIRNIEQKNSTDAVKNAIDIHLSGYIDNLINKLVMYYFNSINIANLAIINYLDEFLEFYYNKYNYNNKKNNPLMVINDIKIRNFIVFFINLCILSSNKTIPKIIKLDNTHFNLSKCKKKIFSKNLKLISKYISDLSDPKIKNLIIPLSEIVNILDQMDKIHESDQKILYWISWLYEYEKSYNHGNYISIPSKHKLYLDTKYNNDFIWIIWRMLIDYSKSKNKGYILKLFRLFKFKYTKGAKRSKSNILITALFILIDPIPKINYPIKLKDDIFIESAKESLRSNHYYYNFYKNLNL